MTLHCLAALKLLQTQLLHHFLENNLSGCFVFVLYYLKLLHTNFLYSLAFVRNFQSLNSCSHEVIMCTVAHICTVA